MARDAGGVEDDAALFLAAGDGDQVAFNRLVQRHAPRLFAVAKRYGCSDADADEIVQDTFWRAWRAASGWRADGAKVSTWLYRVAVNRIVDYRRAAGRRAEEGLDEERPIADAAATPEQALGDRQRLAAMRAAIDTLPERQRMAMILTTQQDMSVSEVAEALDATEGAVEQLMVRARRTLRDRHRRLV